MLGTDPILSWPNQNFEDNKRTDQNYGDGAN